MSRLAPILHLLLAVALAAPLHADVVGVGPNQGLHEIDAALSALSPGGVLIVDPGTYQPFRVTRGVTILARARAFTVAASAGRPAIEVRDLPAGELCILAGFEVSDFLGDHPAIVVSGCAGSVILRAGRVSCSALSGARAAAVVVAERCASVWLQELDVQPALPGGLGAQALGISALGCSRSALLIENCQLRAFDLPAYQGGSALVLNRSRAWILASDLRGGSGALGGHAVLARDHSQALIARSCLRGGAGSSGPRGWEWLALEGSWCYAPLEDLVLLATSGAVDPGGEAWVDLLARSSCPYVLLVSAATSWTMPPCLGEGVAVLDPGRASVLGAGIATAWSATRALAVSVPPDPVLRGTTLLVQALVGSALAPGRGRWSAPGLLSVR